VSMQAVCVVCNTAHPIAVFVNEGDGKEKNAGGDGCSSSSSSGDECSEEGLEEEEEEEDGESFNVDNVATGEEGEARGVKEFERRLKPFDCGRCGATCRPRKMWEFVDLAQQQVKRHEQQVLAAAAAAAPPDVLAPSLPSSDSGFVPSHDSARTRYAVSIVAHISQASSLFARRAASTFRVLNRPPPAAAPVAK